MSKQLVERVDRFLSALPPEIANEAAYLFEQMQNQRRYWKKKYLVRSVDWGNTKKQRDVLLDAVTRCYKMLLSEPDTRGAWFKAENILREAIADTKGAV